MSALFAALAYGGILLTRGEGRIATLWLPNAVLAGLLLRTRTNSSPYYIAGCLVANVLGDRLLDDDWPTSIALACANAIEVILFVWSMRRLCGRNPAMDRLTNLGILSLTCLAAPAVSGGIAAVAFGGRGTWFDAHLFLSWTLADGLSMMIVTPIVMIGVDAWRNRRRPTARDAIEWGLLIAGTTLGAGLVFGQSTYPFLFLAAPLVLFAAFRTGITGTAVSVLLITAVASIATYYGVGPIMLVRGGTPEKLVAFQLFLATIFAMGLPVVTALAARTRIARELAESEARNRAILDNMREIIFHTNRMGRWVFLSSAWQDFTGYSVAESLGGEVMQLIHPDDRDLARGVGHQLDSGAIAEATLRLRMCRKSGEYRHAELSLRRLADAGGRPIGSIGNIRDVSDLVRREQELAQSESRFRRIAEASPVGIFRADTSGVTTYVNPAWLWITGFEEHDARRHARLSSGPHPEDRERVLQAWRDAIGGQREFRDEYRWVRADGSIAWVDVVARPELSDTGEVVGFIGVTMDVTHRHEIEQELIDREAQLALLADNVADAVFRIALDGACLYASPSVRGLLEIDPIHLIGASMLERFHPDDDAQVKAAFHALAAGEIESYLIAYRSERIRCPGSFLWLEANCRLVREPVTGAPMEVVASIRDVSVNKALETELVRARASAEEAAMAKSAFLANMSHEIRTPMNGVIGFTELLLAEPLDETQRGYLNLIANSGRAMLRLLNDILDTSKIEAGQMRVTREPVDVRHKLRNCVSLMEGVAQSKQVRLTVETDDAVPPFVVSDSLRLRQILLNLIGNAVKFTEYGSVKVRATIDGPDGEAMLRFDVIDTGVGIAPDRLEVIFQQFKQADDSIARRFGGTGLGLSISSELARLMGGTIAVTSEVGVGTTFSLLLPLCLPRAPADSVQGTGADEPAIPTERAAPRVLIAEDHDINQKLVMAMARSAGMAPTLAADGAEAVAMVRAAATAGTQFDLVLMDVQMPVVDGLEATRRLRAAGFSPEALPIVALTANAYSEDVAACLAAGMQAHLSKPVRIRDLAAILSRFVAGADGATTAVATRPGADLDARFAERKRDTLETLARLARQGALSGEEVADVAERLHKLAGSAGLFGEASLGDVASRFEQALRKAAPDQRRALVEAAWTGLRNAA